MRGQGRGAIEALPSGKVRASFRAPDGSRERRTFDDEDDATLWLASKRIDVKRGVWAPIKPPPPTLGDYAARWIAERRNRRGQPLKPRTRAEYAATVARNMATLTGLPLDAITPAVVRTWYVGMDDRPTSQANAYGLLSAIMGTAVVDELVDRSPCLIRGGATKDRASQTTILTPTEVESLAGLMPAHLRALVLVSAYCGLRMGEAFALQRDDVAPDGSAVTVARAVTTTKGEVHTGVPKSEAGLRTVAIPPHIAGAVTAHLALWTGPEPTALVFTSTLGTQLRPGTLYRHFYAARDGIGRPDLRWHDLRHTGATLATQSGATVREVQARIGHATLRAAMLYQHATDERDRAIAERMSEAARLRSVN